MPLRRAGINPARTSEDLPLPDAPMTARKEVSLSLSARSSMSFARPKKMTRPPRRRSVTLYKVSGSPESGLPPRNRSATGRLRDHLRDGPPDTRYNIRICFVRIIPISDGPGIFRKGLQLAERRGGPVALADDDGNYARFPFRVTLHRPIQLNVVTIIGGEKVGADQQEDDFGRFEVVVNSVLPIRPCADIAVVPSCDDALALQQPKVFY